MKRKGAAKPAVVLLHGLGGSSADWGQTISFLAPTFATFAVDLPGSSLAPGHHRDFSPEALATWLSDTLRAKGIEKPHLVGHSLGGRVAGELAARQGPVSSLLLVAPLGAVGYSLTDRLKWKAMSRTAILRSVPEAQMRRALSYGFAVEGPGKEGFVKRALASRTGPHMKMATEAIERSVDGVLEAPPLSQLLRGSSFPVGLVVGEEDPLVPVTDTLRLRDTRKDLRLFRLPSAGHYPMLDGPKEFAKLLEKFLTSA